MTLDVVSNSPFFHKQTQGNFEENPVINQMLPRAFLHSPLQLSSFPSSTNQHFPNSILTGIVLSLLAQPGSNYLQLL